ncbi:MAG: alanine--glyoxylate aminotransferase family protein, partial [cyanobacterium endosymbiont of Rhopalodia inflata]
IFRIGHLVFVSERYFLTVIAALESALITLGSQKAAPGVGVAAASKILG